MSTRSRSASIIGSVCSSLPVEKSVESTSEKLELPYARIATKEDVIRQFFNQIVEFAIEDMFVIELEGKKSTEEAPTESETVIKDFKELDKQDLSTSEITAVEGSKLSLKKNTSSRLSRKKMKSTSGSKLNIVQEGCLEKVRKSTSGSKISIIQEVSLEKKSSTTYSNSLLSDSFFEEERFVKITFTNGNTYEGQISKRIMNGKGIYRWSDGTVYEGDFLDGFPTGEGEMILPDLSRYVGSFNKGFFHGKGFLNVVATPTFYSGHWKDGKKHGKGWLLYDPGDWYDGEWSNDLKDGFGVRYYKNGAKYRGMWRNGVYEGEGIMIWENNDYYKGEWSEGTMHGQGEYIWKAFFNKSFTFPVQNIYKGSWNQGKRCGKGVMHFGGNSGSRLRGTWEQNFKHGGGYMICGNGTVVDRSNFFHCDKPLLVPSSTSLSETPYTILEVPVFTIPEEVDVNYYIDRILEKLKGEDPEKLQSLKAFEAKCIQHTIIQFLPQLNDLYKNYATTCARNEELQHQPLLARIFLWHFYRDIDIYKYGISLVEVDQILADNPKSALDSLHNPFEPIYFWQFLMSLIGVALMTCSLENELDEPTTEGVCAYIIKRFFEETVFKKPANDKNSLVFTYVDLVPIKSVYALYLKLGEPHTAKTFLRNCCIRRSDIPLLCYTELFHRNSDPEIGKNAVILAENVTFLKGKEDTELIVNEEIRHNWTSLFNLRHLGPKNIVRCLSNVCPTIIQDDIIVNIDYPLTFLEFYETLLTCIFMVLDLELKKEKKIIEQDLPTPVYQTQRKKSGSGKGKISLKSGDSQKKITKGDKKSGKTKKK